MKPIDNRTSKRKPWMKWYTSDWRAEPTLRVVSRAARSVWVDMLGLMHESTLIGTLLLNGRIPSLQDLAKVLGDDPQKLAEWMDELKDAGVYSVDEDGAIYSRKMRHAAEISEKGRKDVQKRGGSWAPGKKKPNPKGKPNGDPNRGAIGDPMPQRLDTRTKEEELEPTLSSSSQAHNSEANASEPSGSKPPIGDLFVPKVEQEPAPTPKPTAASPIDLEAEMWRTGKSYLIENGVSKAQAGALIGKWRKALGNDDLEVMRLLRRSQAECAAEPVAFIEGMINHQRKAKTNGRAAQNGQSRSPVFDEAYDAYVAARAEREAARH